MKHALLVFLLSIFTLPVVGQTSESAVNGVLNNIHKYASEAKFEAYFALYTPDAIFLGTDATERWTIEQFKGYAKPSFDAGRGWTYTMTDRNIYLSPDENTAWFDETLENAAFGTCRGTGALIKINGEWKVTQYNLTVPIPNDLLRPVANQIREYQNGQ